MMEAASTSETSVNFYQTTQRNNQENSHLQILESLEVLFHDWIVSSGMKFIPSVENIIQLVSVMMTSATNTNRINTQLANTVPKMELCIFGTLKRLKQELTDKLAQASGPISMI
jgi:hypothetical protein